MTEDFDDFVCGNWEPGRYAWRAVDFVAAERPIPIRGHQGLFEVPDWLLGIIRC
jgi:hypothetical protein